MKVRLNGEEKTIGSGNIYDLITEIELDHSSVVVELNKKIIKKENWRSTGIKKDDSIEILSFVGGG